MNARTPSTPAPAEVAEAALFFNVVNFLLQPGDTQQEPYDESKAAAADTSTSDTATSLAQIGSPLTASAAQIADALLRSMLGIRQPAAASQNGQPRISGRAVKRDSNNTLANRPSDVPVRVSTSQNPLMMLSGASVPVPVFAPVPPQDAAGSASAEPAAPVEAAADLPGTPGPPISSAVPWPQTELAFGAKLTPKSEEPDTASSSPGPSLPIPPQAGAAPKRATEPEPETPILQGSSAPGTNLVSQIAAVAPAIEISSRPSPAFASAMTEPQRVPAPPQAEPPAASTSLAQIREVTVRIAPPGAPPVDVQVNQRQGEVHVVVRTSDDAMQLSLRQDLSQLVNALDRAGFRAETFTPNTSSEPLVRSAAETSFGNLSQNSSQYSPQYSPQDSKQDSTGERGPSGNGLSYSSGEREQQQQQQRQREHLHHSWQDQMEE